MVELSKCALYLVVYGHIYITLLVIPIQVQYVVWFTFPIDGYLVMVFDRI